MKAKLQKGTFETCLIFILSPFLSIPFIFTQLKRGYDKGTTLLISLLMGLISFKFVPSSGFDKTVYINRFNEMSLFGIDELKDYFVYNFKPDYLFDLSIYLFSKTGLSFHYLFFLLTTITVYSFLVFVKKTNSYLLKKDFRYTPIYVSLVLLTFSLSGLFSGIRFILGGSAFIWVIYYFFINRKLVKGVIFFTLAVLTHFSYAFFIPPVLLLFFYPKKIDPRLLLLISLMFIVLPKSILGDLFSILEMPDSYSLKTQSYLDADREYTQNALILSFLSNIWVYFSYLFFLFFDKRNRDNKLALIYIILISFINITYSEPLVFNRYLVIPGFVLSSYLINMRLTNQIKKEFFYIFFFLIAMSFMIGIYKMRPHFMATFKLNELWTIVNVLSNKFGMADIL